MTIGSWGPKNLNIRRRLLLFGNIWLFLCTATLTIYLVSTARHALLEGATQRAQLLAQNLGQQVKPAIYSGNNDAIEKILANVQALPDVLDARIAYPGTEWADIRSASDDQSGALSSNGLRTIQVNGSRAILSYAVISTLAAGSTGFDLPIFDIKADVQPEENPRALVVVSVEPIYAQIDDLMIKAALFLTVVLLVGLFLGYLVSGKMVSPLRQLAAHIESMAEESANGRQNSASMVDEIESINNGVMVLKNRLDNTAAALAHLTYRLEDKVREKTADLEKRNTELGKILIIKNDLIVQLTHELNTPLYALENHLRFVSASARASLKQQQVDRLERTLALCTRLRRMIEVILEFAVRESGKIQIKRERVIMADVAAQVAFLLETLAEQKEVRCIADETLLGKDAYADPDHVEQILLNLVTNAIKASPREGIIRIGAVEHNSHIEVYVEDHGSGIPPSLQQKLFRSNVLPKMEGGHGVGLYISRCLVELQGGQIRFETDPGKGSTLIFTLPKYPAANPDRNSLPPLNDVIPEEPTSSGQGGYS